MTLLSAINAKNPTTGTAHPCLIIKKSSIRKILINPGDAMHVLKNTAFTVTKLYQMKSLTLIASAVINAHIGFISLAPN